MIGDLKTMMELQKVFNFNGYDIRTEYDDDGNILFCGKDVAEVLGYKRERDAIQTHVDTDDAVKHRLRSGGQIREMTFINEFGVNDLILGSKLPAAKKFKHWITHEVLPTLRKTGSYTMPGATPQHYIPENYGKALILCGEQALLLEEQKPKVEAADQLIERGDSLGIRATVKEFGVGERAFIQWLINRGSLYRAKNKDLFPTAKAIEQGIMVLKEGISGKKNYQQALITPLGRVELHTKYKNFTENTILLS